MCYPLFINKSIKKIISNDPKMFLVDLPIARLQINPMVSLQLFVTHLPSSSRCMLPIAIQVGS